MNSIRCPYCGYVFRFALDVEFRRKEREIRCIDCGERLDEILIDRDLARWIARVLRGDR